MSEVRLLSTADIPAGMRLKEAAGWNQTAADWQRVLALEPDGCFAIECDGQVRATTTAVCFGEELAWVGMVLTDAQYRGRGFARRLMEHTLAYVRGKRVAWIKLDATDMGRPLYERLGFDDEGTIERWIRQAGAVPRLDSSVGNFYFNPALDRQAFGADRSRLLQVLASIESWFLGKHAEESVYWDILPANGEAVALAREFGFEPVRRLARMALAGVENPPVLRNDDTRVYAAAGFEFG